MLMELRNSPQFRTLRDKYATLVRICDYQPCNRMQATIRGRYQFCEEHAQKYDQWKEAIDSDAVAVPRD